MNEPPRIVTFKREEFVDQKPASVAIHVSASSSFQSETLPECSGFLAAVDSLDCSRNSIIRNNSTEIDIPVKSEPVDRVPDNDGIKAEFLMDSQPGGMASLITVDQDQQVVSSTRTGQLDLVDSKEVSRNEQTHGEGPFQCSFCDKSFAIKDNLNRHERAHTGAMQFSCYFCGKSFATKDYLNRHKRTHGEGPFQCSFCEKIFAIKDKLNQHERVHTRKRPFQCSFCTKTFLKRYYLTVHERTHTGEKPLQCSFCGESFATRYYLNMHERTHTGEKPFQCSLCTKTFTSRYYLNGHKQTHTGERQFQCSFCEKTFAVKNTLNRHERTHTEERPFQCSLCEKSFALKQNLNWHERRIHTGENLSISHAAYAPDAADAPMP